MPYPANFQADAAGSPYAATTSDDALAAYSTLGAAEALLCKLSRLIDAMTDKADRDEGDAPTDAACTAALRLLDDAHVAFMRANGDIH